jgi:hypothetical protein
MGDEAVLADLDPVDKPAFDHVPAEQSLAKAEGEDTEQAWDQPARQAPAQPEPDQWGGVRDPDQPAQQPVRIFPEIDAFEFGKAHPVMDQAVFGDLLVPGEFRGPLGLGQRRDDADDRVPLGDRQA